MSVAPYGISAARQVLWLPELLTMILEARELKWNIFQHVLSDDDLKNVIRVNRFWFEIGSRKLWASLESIFPLLYVRPARRQIYASKVTQITSRGQPLELIHHTYRDLVFERLREAIIRINQLCTMEHVKPFLVPCLRSFCLIDDRDLRPEVFSQLARACPNLRHIKIYAHKVRSRPTLEAFSSFIRQALFLKEVTVILHGNNTANAELLSSLAHSSRLERLQTSWLWTTCQSRQAAAAVSHSGIVPFPKITHMNILVRSKAVGKLVPLVANIQHLAMTVRDSNDDVLSHVSNLGNLKSFIIHYQLPCFIPRQSLLGLGALSRLLFLNLCSCSRATTGGNVVWSNLSDDDVEVLARRLPNLYDLRLRLRCDISTRAVESFLRHCPRLRVCSIVQRLDTTDLFTSTSDDMVFPQLRRLCLGGLSGEAIMSRLDPAQFCASFERQFPGVNYVELGHGSNAERDYYDEVFDLWRASEPGRFWESIRFGHHPQAAPGVAVSQSIPLGLDW
ncbi:uncharacterized protein TrAtP1_011380 [Trichoderma atroviride]|uniref:uncharacterized protein n=1 Tax=Hypocrea atroviridis TaxID=63577 RepID=UPI003319BFAE|nr:hypothetical protein TrAtP1_011380 [Trichoderma atroviride]